MDVRVIMCVYVSVCVCTFTDHLLGGIDVHGELHEVSVEEWGAGLHTPGGGALVGAEAIEVVKGTGEEGSRR